MTRDRTISYVTVQVQSLQLIQHLLELFQVEAVVALLVMPVTSGELKKDPTSLIPRDLQVVQDCIWDRNPLGADPQPCFADLGEAIRRCRIDFRAEITLSLDAFIPPKDSRLTDAHFVVGDVVYDREHVRQLGWGDVPNVAARKGMIVWLKPSLVNKDPAEVRQYALENKIFPQQTTADQWFDESQFESYRRLGEECAKVAIADPRVGPAFPVI